MIRKIFIAALYSCATVIALTAELCPPDGPSAGPPPAPSPPLELVPVTQSYVTGLNFPVMLSAPLLDSRVFIVEQPGLIRIAEDGVLRPQPFLDLREKVTFAGEQGLLGLAFAPDYRTSGLFYVNYVDTGRRTIIARYATSADPDLADAGSAEILLAIPQPFANHNGGHLAFGPDGYLYIGMGDGGSGGDPGNRAQSDATLLGKMLRIDVGGGLGSGYSIPPDNPFAGQALPLPEIWAKGLRNPYRFSFDRIFGDLYIADVGQSRREEVNVEGSESSGGRNYGWRLMEGKDCFIPASNCNDGTLTLPVHDYAHAGGRCSVTGGYVYRGSVPALFGHYFFADFCTAEVFSFVWDGAGGIVELANRTADLAPPEGFRSITGFGEDGFADLYVVQFGGGVGAGGVFKIVGVPAVPAARLHPEAAGSAPIRSLRRRP
jgi:glucose/arabinose dehydrogenase